MAVRNLALVVTLLGCSTPAATAPAPDQTFTMETSPAVATKPFDESPEVVPFGSSPWVGRLVPTTHHYSHGCTDPRVVDLLALVIDGTPAPIILGRFEPLALAEPHFLTQDDALPKTNPGGCVKITGAVVVYAHEGYFGIPAYAIEASSAEPISCP